MKDNYCLPIIEKKKSDVIKIIQEHQSEYTYFEIWLDYIDNLDKTFLEDLRANKNNKIILLFRRKNLEPIHMSFEKRKEIIEYLKYTHILFDLDITQKDEIKYCITNNYIKRVIVSYHNYEKTPDEQSLKEIITKIQLCNPYIIKISTMCRNEKDVHVLLKILLILKARKQKYIVLGMGEKGKITRIIGSMWGNEITFAPIAKGKSSAPGQLSKQTLDTIFQLL